MFCKKLLPAFILFLIFSSSAGAQSDQNDFPNDNKNIVKLNLSALVVKNISFQYERSIGSRTSVVVNIHTIPFGKLPFAEKIANQIGQSAINYNKFNIGSFGVTPEFRYYIGKKGALHGFYFGPMLNITNYKMDVPINYADVTGIFSGKVNTISGGIQFGAQWQLSKKLYLDWWILGPSYGSQKGDLNLASNLTPIQQRALRSQLNDLKNDKFFKNVIDSYSVNADGAIIKSKGPWAAVRAFGINLGFAF